MDDRLLELAGVAANGQFAGIGGRIDRAGLVEAVAENIDGRAGNGLQVDLTDFARVGAGSPAIGVKMLLRSWATPLARRPTLSRRCWRSM
mgnify:CR=1 FL=1